MDKLKSMFHKDKGEKSSSPAANSAPDKLNTSAGNQAAPSRGENVAEGVILHTYVVDN